MANNDYYKFQNKYRIPSNRWSLWNYDANGHYFITIVTHNRNHLFGEITDGKMVLNDIGNIINKEFFKSFEIRTDLFMCEYVIMPNHLHAIVYLNHPSVETHSRASNQSVETHSRASNQSSVHTSPQRKPLSISSFIAGFKSSSVKQVDNWIDSNNKQISKYGKHHPMWQSNYHDHIIRDAEEYRNIADYINNNPTKWQEDELMQTCTDNSF